LTVDTPSVNYPTVPDRWLGVRTAVTPAGGHGDSTKFPCRPLPQLQHGHGWV